MLVVGALNRAGIVTTVENSVVVPAQGPLG
jgi:hypothetical protein